MSLYYRRGMGGILDKTVTIRYFSVSKVKDTAPSLVDVLRSIAAKASRKDRERQLAAYYVVRLENFEDDGADGVVGELVRCQNTNLPGSVSDAGMAALTVDRLGHSIVFRYNHKNGTLGIQYDARIISPARLLEYVSAFNPQAIYSMAPKVNKDAWAKFKSGRPRKLTIRIANPESLDALDGASSAATKGIKAMAEAYDAPYVTVEISMGNRKGALSSAIIGMADQMSKLLGGAHVERMSATSIVNDESEDIDLIEDRVQSRETLQLHDRDPVQNWKIKRDHLCQDMKKLFG